MVWSQASEQEGEAESIRKKSHIRETKNLSTDADSSTDHKVIHNFHLLYPYLKLQVDLFIVLLFRVLNSIRTIDSDSRSPLAFGAAFIDGAVT